MSTEQPDFLRADHVSDADMQALTEANDKIVNYRGRKARLHLNGWVELGKPRYNYVTLDFDWPNGGQADGDFTDVLERLNFLEP